MVVGGLVVVVVVVVVVAARIEEFTLDPTTANPTQDHKAHMSNINPSNRQATHNSTYKSTC